MANRKTNSPRLTFDDAVEVWKRYWAGEYQHRIAAYFDVNAGRINEVIKRKRHVGSEAIASSQRD